MAEQKQQRRIEEVAPGLVRLVDGNTYVYLSSASADLLAEKYSLTRSNLWHGDGSARPMPQQDAPNA